jgi:manganese transport protein
MTRVDEGRPAALSLDDIHSTVAIPPRQWWRRFLAFAGPAFLVSVGYMDPGNWATDLEAGSRFGYRLLWVLLLSNLMAVLLQSLATRLGVVTGRDLAQACRDYYPRPVVWLLWVLTEIAIAATDLAEISGTVIALNMLFGLPYLWGLLVATGDTFVLLALQRRGVRWLELVTLLLIGVIAGSFIIEIVFFRPDWAGVAGGFVPSVSVADGSLYVAIAIIGATVMPHNLYLHSALVQTRAFPQTPAGKRLACRYNLWDSLLALNGAFLVNAAILVLSVSTFWARGQVAETLQDAHQLLGEIWPSGVAALLFAIALLASGQSSTLTGTLAGQVVMEGFVRLRLRPWARRLLTRLLAILPALAVILWAGRQGGQARQGVDVGIMQLIVFSQVLLGLQLPFAIVPLLQFTSDRRRMQEFANGAWLRLLGWACTVLLLVLNVILLWQQIDDWAGAAAEAGGQPAWVYGPAAAVGVAMAALLGYVAVYPWLTRRDEALRPVPTPALPRVRYARIGVAVELEGRDDAVLAQAAALAQSHGAALIALHVVEGTAAELLQQEADDLESRRDRSRMTELTEHLRTAGLPVEGVLGYGTPADELVRLAREQRLDLLVVGAHGHRLLADLALGRTVSPVLHRLTIPVLVVPGRPAPPADH